MYELQRGRLADAERMTDASLQYVPDYAAALLARGRIQLAQSKTADAAATLERAARLNPLPEYQWTLADALRLLNRTDEAAALEQQLVGDGASGDPAHARALPVDAPRRTARRPSSSPGVKWQTRGDVFTLDALAWALASAGQVARPRRSWPGRSPKAPRTAACSSTRR